MRATTKKILRVSILGGLSGLAIGGALSPPHGIATTFVAVDRDQLTYVGVNARNEIMIFPSNRNILLSDKIRIVSENGCRAPNPVSGRAVECSRAVTSLKAELAGGHGPIKAGIPFAGTVFGREGDRFGASAITLGISRADHTDGTGNDSITYRTSSSKVAVKLDRIGSDRRSVTPGDGVNDIDGGTGGSVDDSLESGPGNDILDGGPGRDPLKGSGGLSFLVADDSTADALIDCDDGGATRNNQVVCPGERLLSGGPRSRQPVTAAR